MTKFTGTDATVAIVDFFLQNGNDMPYLPRKALRQQVISGNLRSQILEGIQCLYASRQQVQVAQLLQGLTRFVVQVVKFSGQVDRCLEINQVALRIQAGGQKILQTDPQIAEYLQEEQQVLTQQQQTTQQVVTQQQTNQEQAVVQEQNNV